MLRLGRVSFINTFPVEWALSRHLDPDEVREVAAVPTELNRMLAARELDVANVSSVEYADNPERYVLLPSLCVGSDGAVESVQLVTQLPLPAVRSVAVTSQSATSVALVQVLVPHAEIRPEGEDGRRPPADRRRRAALGVLRSDAASRPRRALARAHRPADGVRRLGGPARLRSRTRSRASTARCSGAVAEASEHADLVARAAGERHGFPAGYLARYFEKLRYGFGERERAGLERFYALAAERGAIAGAPELRFADTARVR